MRDVSKTAPYMQDGSLERLENVVEHFSTGGVGHANQSDSVYVIELDAEEKSAMQAFLRTLDGDTIGVK